MKCLKTNSPLREMGVIRLNWAKLAIALKGKCLVGLRTLKLAL